MITMVEEERKKWFVLKTGTLRKRKSNE